MRGPKAQLYEVGRRSLASERDDRYGSCRAMARDLDAYLRGGAAGRRLRRRRKLPLLPLTGLLIGAPLAYLAYQ